MDENSEIIDPDRDAKMVPEIALPAQSDPALVPSKPKGILKTSQNHAEFHAKSAKFDEQNVLAT